MEFYVYFRTANDNKFIATPSIKVLVKYVKIENQINVFTVSFPQYASRVLAGRALAFHYASASK